MGQRTATETLFGIIAAFVEQRTWSQADLARRLDTQTDTIRKRLAELQATGFKLERSEDRPHVYWSVPKDWFPGALLFKPEEIGDLLRVLGRAPRSALREQVLSLVVARLASLGNAHGAKGFDPALVHAPAVREDEERWLAVVEDAVRQRVPVKMRYFTASRKDVSWRHVSVHRVDLGPRPQFIGTCHTANALRRFRVSSVLEAQLDKADAHRKVDKRALQAFDDESFGGYRQEGRALRCSFTVRDPEAAWVVGNLPDDRIAHENLKGATRFTVVTSAVDILARFVVGLGEAATVETPELASAVKRLARGALQP